MKAEELIAFEARVKAAIEAGEVRGPVHLSGGNEEQLIRIFEDINPTDYVFSTYRSHYHALLHGVWPEWLYAEILAGRSMNIQSYRFYSSAIVGGCLPIALGLAAGIRRRGGSERVWCFVGDMAASLGTFHDCHKYGRRNDLPITFVVEDNGMSTNTQTEEAWGRGCGPVKTLAYCYLRTSEHIGAQGVF